MSACEYQGVCGNWTHNVPAHEPTLANWFRFQYIRVLHYDPVTGLQEISHCFLVDMGEYLAVYLDKERIRKLAEGFCGCRGRGLTHFHDAGGFADLA